MGTVGVTARVWANAALRGLVCFAFTAAVTVGGGGLGGGFGGTIGVVGGIRCRAVALCCCFSFTTLFTLGRGGRAIPLVPLLADSSPVADMGDSRDVLILLR